MHISKFLLSILILSSSFLAMANSSIKNNIVTEVNNIPFGKSIIPNDYDLKKIDPNDYNIEKTEKSIYYKDINIENFYSLYTLNKYNKVSNVFITINKAEDFYLLYLEIKELIEKKYKINNKSSSSNSFTIFYLDNARIKLTLYDTKINIEYEYLFKCELFDIL